MKSEPVLKIIHLSKKLTCRIRNAFKQSGYDVGYEEWMVIAHAGMVKGLFQNKIAEFTGNDRHYTSRLITSLEKKGYLIRTSDQSDSRLKIVNLTEQGTKIFNELMKIQEETLSQFMSKISSEEADMLNMTMDKLIQNEV